jgi:DNA-binding transcriptional LysR family regulator
VVRLGSVKQAAVEIGVSESAISLHVGHLRKEFADDLFTRTASGLAFTPGGLRLARRATEMLNLQERTIIEVSQANAGHRMLRVAASSLFAEHAAPGLIEMFTGRADDLDIELSVHRPERYAGLLHSRAVDVAIGPPVAGMDDAITCTQFLNYQVFVVAGPGHPLAGLEHIDLHRLRDQMWFLGPSAMSEAGAVRTALRRLNVPEKRQRIFQSHAAAIEETKGNNGVTLALSFTVTRDISQGNLARVGGRALQFGDRWNIFALRSSDPGGVVEEFGRFVRTPRAAQAMLRGPGVKVGRFRPSVHVTLWS